MHLEGGQGARRDDLTRRVVYRRDKDEEIVLYKVLGNIVDSRAREWKLGEKKQNLKS